MAYLRSSTARDIIPSPQSGHRNIVINGAMRVAQYGTTSTSANAYVTCDRFRLTQGGMDQLAITQTQAAITAGQNEGFRNSYKITIGTAESAQAVDEYQHLEYRVEARDITHANYGDASAKTMTLSFYVRSNENGVYALALYQSDGDRNIGTTYTISDTTWQRVTWTIPADTAGTINNDTGIGLTIYWRLAAGSNYTSADNTSWAGHASNRDAYGHTANLVDAVSNYWEVTGVQLELGSVATPFEHLNYVDDLARCQRYFYAHVPLGTSADPLVGKGAFNNSAQFEATVHYKQTMRTNPTLSVSNATNHFRIHFNGTSITFDTIGINSVTNPNCQSVYAGSLSGNAGYGGNLVATTTAAYVYFSAEL